MIDLYIFFVFLLSSFLQTVTGFGYAIITAPLMALVLGAKETVMLVILTSLIISTFLVRATRNQGSFKAIRMLLTTSIIGAIPGSYVMTIISNDGLKVFIGILLVLLTTALWKNYSLPVQHNKYVEAVVGLISGFLTTTTGIPGALIVLYYLNSKAEENKTEFRANLARYFLSVTFASVIFSYLAGSINLGDLWFHTLLSIPALCIGFFLGEKMFYRISVSTLRTACLLMILISSIAILWSALSTQI